MRAFVVAVIAGAIWSVSAAAQPVSEVRVGVFDHDVAYNEGSGGKESGFNVQLEAVFASPGLLKPLLSPRPYLNFSWNSAGATNFGGGGVTWTTPRDRRIYGGLDFGVVIHDGIAFWPDDPSQDPVYARIDEERTVLGSRELFRTTLSASARVTDRIDVQATIEHLSHGQVLGNGRNEGLDNVGARLIYRFD